METAKNIKVEGVKIPLSKIILGTAMDDRLSKEEIEHIFDTCMERGINTFDTARGYGPAESNLGNWLNSRKNREQIVIISKCGDLKQGKVHIDGEVIKTELETSLRELKTDYIDIYLLHRDDPKTPIQETMEALNQAKKEGKIRKLGVSNWTHERIMEANAYAKENGLEGFSVSSPNYGLAITANDPWGGNCVSISNPEEEKARAWYEETQMPVIAYSSLGRGFLSGKFKSGDYEKAKTLLDEAAQRGYLCEENMRRLQKAEVLAKRYDTSVSDIAMRFVYATNMNMFAVFTTSNPKRIADNIMSSNRPLSKEDVEFLLS